MDESDNQTHLVLSPEDDEKKRDMSESSSLSTSESGEYVEREKWGSKFEFILSCVGFAVAYGNMMRFPYLCMRNGGGAFLIPFFLFMLLCGFPLYYLEVCLGQFSGSSPLFVWRMAPLLKGLGWLMIVISGIVCWYYNTILAWVLYYLFNSFYPKLPWSTCDNDWNTENCFPSDPEARDLILNSPNTTITVNGTIITFVNTTTGNMLTGSGNESIYETAVVRNISSAKQFWQFNVLNLSEGIDTMGNVQMHLVLSLLAAWVIVFLCLIKGVKSVGKVVYVTAILPYVLLVVFFIRGLTLPGSGEGIRFYLSPDFNRLLDSQVWIEAAVQVFYSLGPTWGGVITMASYNKFRNPCLLDTVIACLSDCLTSFFAGFVVFPIIGYMAYELKQPIEEVATAGPGLMFIAYPEAISRMPLPHLWAVLFFIMLITVGIDTQFGMFETLSSGIVDAFPHHLKKRKMLVTATLACGLFLLGLPFTTSAGIYIYNLVDWYSGSICMALGGFLELIAVGWYYGADRFSDDMKLMLGSPAPVLLRICWCIVSPICFLFVFILLLYRYQAVTYQGYEYPTYAITIGHLVALIPVLPIPIGIIMAFVNVDGTFKQKIKQLLVPEDWKPNDRKLWDLYDESEKPRAHNVKEYIHLTLLGRNTSTQVPSDDAV